ncbi:MAG: 50S ribosomal protein L6 [Patescibacteria group bacterium]
MSRIGKQIIAIPAGVTVSVSSENIVSVKGPKGELTKKLNRVAKVKVENDTVAVDVVEKEVKYSRSIWGTAVAHIKNMIVGVTQGFKKELEINGVGYKVAMAGSDLRLEVGYSHPVIFKLPPGVKGEVEKNVIRLAGFDKELLGDTAAKLRKVRPPEPYKGKGIKYLAEIVRRKAGKTAAKGA